MKFSEDTVNAAMEDIFFGRAKEQKEIMKSLSAKEVRELLLIITYERIKWLKSLNRLPERVKKLESRVKTLRRILGVAGMSPETAERHIKEVITPKLCILFGQPSSTNFFELSRNVTDGNLLLTEYCLAEYTELEEWT